MLHWLHYHHHAPGGPYAGRITAMPRPKTNHRTSTAPRPHERRAAGAYPYYRVAWWDARSLTYRDKPKPIDTLGEAMAAGKQHADGFRITEITEHAPPRIVFTYQRQDASDAKTL